MDRRFSDVNTVVFDIDQTLLPWIEMKRAAIKGAARQISAIEPGLSYDAVRAAIIEVYRQNGVEYQFVLQDALAQLGVEPYKRDRLVRNGRRGYLDEKNKQMKPYGTVVPTLSALRERGFNLCAMSDATQEEVWERLVQTSLDLYFGYNVVAAHDGIRKPDPRFFQEALTYFNIQPHQSMMVGDVPSRDIKGAKQAGMRTAWIKWDINYDGDFDEIEHRLFYPAQRIVINPFEEPDTELTNLNELLDILPRHAKKPNPS
ncbi:MAG: HAD-IA family hydrolase [Candidatus Aenigmarchaeota archaeon]|nr:HAD-IA family hydrolase [Candidatus Aenigmarchaeota archaeon]